MNPDIKAQWVAALRSGQYEQAEGKLHRIEGEQHSYCCLGVLCDLAVKAELPVEVVARSRLAYYDGSLDLPPVSVREWAGVSNIMELEVTDEDGDDDLVEITELNDNYGYTFEQLAALIEDQL